MVVLPLVGPEYKALIYVNVVNFTTWCIQCQHRAMPKSATPNTYHHGDLRNALLRVAAELVVSHGVEGFSLREAARRVGVTPTACYRHFADKAALLTAVASEGFAKMALSMETQMTKERKSPRAGTSPTKQAVKRFFAVGNAYVRFAVDNPAQFRVMFGPYGAGGDKSVRGVSTQSGKDPYEIFVAALDDLVDSGVITPQSRIDAELPAWAAIHGLAALLVDDLINITTKADLVAAIDKVISNILRGLGYCKLD